MRRRTVPAGVLALALVMTGLVAVGHRVGEQSGEPAGGWAPAPAIEVAPAVADDAPGDATVSQFGVVVPDAVAGLVDPATGTDDTDDAEAATRVEDVLTADPGDVSLAADTVTADGDVVVLDIVDDAARAASAVIEPAEAFASLGFTWPVGESATPALQARVRALDGTWGDWFTLTATDSGPDQATVPADVELRASTDPVWVGEADAVQIASTGDAASAVPVDDVRLVTVTFPEAGGSSVVPASFGGGAEVATSLSVPGVATAVAAPPVVTRAQWGARAPRCTGTAGHTWGAAQRLQAAVVHHTAGSNGYANQADAIRQLRADQAYHMDARGWCDLGYNFVVDRFGTIYEGAAGSMTAPIIGAHASGFNTGTVGISILGCYGNCSTALGNIALPDVTVNAVARVVAWRLGAYGVDPSATITFDNGSSRRTMPAVVGHRDVAATACPGDFAYARLGDIRRVAAASVRPPAPTTPALEYRAHVESVGWQGWVGNGATAGTSGRSLRIEALQLRLASSVAGGIECSAHVQNIGWTGFVGAGQTCGTSGRSLRVEAMRLRLTGELAQQFDVWYRVHVQSIGWLDWAKNGADAGSAGMSLRDEAIEVRLVPRGQTGPSPQALPFVPVGLSVTAHVATLGWRPPVGAFQTAGTSGRSLGLEALRVSATSPWAGGLECRAHVQNVGWTGWVGNGAVCGTTGRGLRQEALALRLTGAAASRLDVWYRVHVQDVGWMGWARNGAQAGTAGFSRRVEAVEVVITPRGAAAPGTTARPFLAS